LDYVAATGAVSAVYDWLVDWGFESDCCYYLD